MLKAIEKAVRAVLLRGLVALFARPAPPLPTWKERPYRVLVLRDDGIGDFVVAVEVIRALAEASPMFSVDVLASPQNAPLARSLPFVRNVIVHRRGFLLRSWPVWRQLWRSRYDVAVDARVAVRNVNMHTTCVLLASRAPWRVGLSGRGNDRVYTVPVVERPAEYWTDVMVMLLAPFGVAAGDRDWRPRLVVSDAERLDAEEAWRGVGSGGPRVMVNLSVGHPERWWPPERYKPVLEFLKSHYPAASVMIVGMPSEMHLARDLAASVGATAVQLSLSQLVAAVAASDLIISPDTAVTHIASAFRIPTVTLQRKGTSMWSPYRTPGRAVFSDDPRRVRDLPAARVIAALDEYLPELGESWVRPR